MKFNFTSTCLLYTVVSSFTVLYCPSSCREMPELASEVMGFVVLNWYTHTLHARVLQPE